MKKIAFVVNNPDFLISHRVEVCISARDSGMQVHIICPNKPSIKILEGFGFIVHFLEFGRDRKNPFQELKTIFQLVKLFRNIQPDLVHLITIKPYLYGGIAACIVNVPAVVSAVAGLGIIFSSNKFKFRLLRWGLYPIFKLAFRHRNQIVIFQNQDDRNSLIEWGVVKDNKAKIIRGSGVDLNRFQRIDEPKETPVVSFAARLLKDKGVEVFVAASKILRDRNILARFWLIGEPDQGNTNSVTGSQLLSWEQDGLVELLGFRKDIPDLFLQSNIITLPSFYGEGLPKVLVEAAASGRAVITTEHPGCRDAIVPNLSGLLVPVRDPVALAHAIEVLIQNPVKRRDMGKAGRVLAEKEFAIERVVDAHMHIYKQLLSKVGG